MPLNAHLAGASKHNYLPPSTGSNPQPGVWDTFASGASDYLRTYLYEPARRFSYNYQEATKSIPRMLFGVESDWNPMDYFNELPQGYYVPDTRSRPQTRGIASMQNQGKRPDIWVPGYEEFYPWFMETSNREEFDAVKRKVEETLERRRKIAARPIVGMLGAVAGGLLDPVNLLFPVARLRALSEAKMAGQTLSASQRALSLSTATAAGVATSEALGQFGDPSLKFEDSVINVGAATVLSGMLGVAGFKLADTIRTRFEKDLIASVEREIGVPHPTKYDFMNELELQRAALQGDEEAAEALTKPKPEYQAPEITKVVTKDMEGTNRFTLKVKSGDETIYIDDWDQVTYHGVPVNQLAVQTEMGLERLVPLSPDANENAFAFGIPEFLRKIPVMRDLVPDVYMMGEKFVKEAQELYFRLVPAVSTQKKQVRGAPQFLSAWQKSDASTKRLLGNAKTKGFELYNQLYARLTGTEFKDRGFNQTRIRAVFRPRDKVMSMGEFFQRTTEYRRARYFGIEDANIEPEIKAFDQYLGEKIYKPLAKWAIENNYLPRDIAERPDFDKFLDTYLPQIINRQEMSTFAGDFDQVVAEILFATDFKNKDALTRYQGRWDLLPDVEKQKYLDEAFQYRNEKLTSLDPWRKVQQINDKEAIFLRPRELQIPINRSDLYDRLKRYLMDDVMDLTDIYTHAVNADKTLDEIFPGDIGLADTIKALDRKYDDLIKAETPKSAKQNALIKERDKVMELIKWQVHRVRGTNPMAANEEMYAVSLSAVRALVNLSRNGGIFLASLTDTARLTGEHTLRTTLRSMGTMMSTLFDDKAFSNVRNLKRAVGLFEIELNTRYNYYADINQNGTRALINKPIKSMAFNTIKTLEREFGNINLMNQWNSGIKQMAMLNSQHNLVEIALKASKGKALSQRELFRITEMFLTEKDLAGIAQQYTKHGGKLKFNHFLNIERWDDTAKELGARVLDGLNKDINTTITTPTPATRPVKFAGLWGDGPVGKSILHLRSFDLSNTTQFTTRTLQLRDKQALMATAELIILGSAVGVLRRKLAGHDTRTDDLAFLITDGIDRSGVMGLFGTVNGMLDRTTGLGLTGQLSGDTTGLRFYDDPISAVAGPSFGYLQNAVFGPFEGAANLARGEPLTEGNVYNTFALMPWRNLFWLRNWTFDPAREFAQQELTGRKNPFR